MKRLSQRNCAARSWNKAVGLMLLVFASGGVVPASAQTLPSDAQATCTVTPAVFASWFQSGSVTLNGVVNPANSVTFPNTPNCSFYQWSKQMFLWMTSPAPLNYGGGGGRIFDSPTFYDVSPPDASGNRVFIPHVPGQIRTFNLRAAQVGPHGLPIAFNRAGRMIEIHAPQLGPGGKQLIRNQAGASVEIERATIGANGKPVFHDKAGRVITNAKPIARPQVGRVIAVERFLIGGKPVFLGPTGNVIDVEEGQAGGGDVLMAQNGSLVYYATMVNDVYAYFLTGAKNGGITPAPTRFPTTAADLAKITAFASAHGKTFPDPNALAIEVKSSWIEAAGLPNLSSYITMQATIPTYTKTPSQWTASGQKTVQLALVGVHVVGSTKGHPEMIWATFEHFGNAPNATYTYNGTTGPNPKTVTQNTSGTWLLAASGAASPFNVAHMTYSSPNVVVVSPNTISASNTIRWKAWGGASDFSPNPFDATTAASNTEIISINNSISGMMPSGDVRNNYFMTGSTWTVLGAAPTGSFKTGSGGGNEVGTSKLSNTTMETYQQGNNTLWATGSNCFTCHRSNTTDVSHIYTPLKALF